MNSMTERPGEADLCPTCKGEKRIRCPRCLGNRGGFVTCPVCADQRTIECPDCHGKGKKT